jgi:2-oxo-3-hexenedioate decarboxylase
MSTPTPPVPAAAAALAPALQALCDELQQARALARQVDPPSRRAAGLTLDDAYRVAAELRARRVAAGEQPRGRKIGFTNRQIWDEYQVWAPIWGTVYDRSLHLFDEQPGAAIDAVPRRDPPQDTAIEPGHGLGDPGSNLAADAALDDEPAADTNIATARAGLARLSEPRIEPEIVFGLGWAPAAGMTPAELLACVDWLAPGFELVHSLYPGWQFAAPDTVAAYGLHGALHVGPRLHLPDGTRQRERWQHALENFGVELRCNGEVMDRGHASHVLEGPLHALRHLVELLAIQPGQPPLAPGEVVTTGTLTRALPVHAGQRWSLRLSGIALSDFSLGLT